MSIKIKLECGFSECPYYDHNYMAGGCGRPEGVSINMDGLCLHAQIVLDSRKTQKSEESVDCPAKKPVQLAKATIAEAYPPNWKHCMIHLNPENGDMHSDGDHSVREWIQDKIKAAQQ